MFNTIQRCLMCLGRLFVPLLIFLSVAPLLGDSSDDNTKLLPHIKFENYSEHSESGRRQMAEVTMKGKLESDIKELPVYRVIPPATDPEWVKDFAMKNFGLKGELETSEYNGVRFYSIKSEKLWFSYNTVTGEMDSRNMSFFGPEFDARKYSSKKGDILADQYEEIASRAIAQYNLKEDGMSYRNLSPGGCSNDGPSTPSNVRSVYFDEGKSIKGFDVFSGGSSANVCISSYGDVVFIEKRWKKLEEVGKFPLKTPEEAFESFKGGTGRLGWWASENKNHLVIDRFEIVYHSSNTSPEFLQPAYVFRGTGALAYLRGRNLREDDVIGVTEAVREDLFLSAENRSEK